MARETGFLTILLKKTATNHVSNLILAEADFNKFYFHKNTSISFISTFRNKPGWTFVNIFDNGMFFRKTGCLLWFSMFILVSQNTFQIKPKQEISLLNIDSFYREHRK